jgi:hypothetical protein
MKAGSAEAKAWGEKMRAARKQGHKDREDEKLGMEVKGLKDKVHKKKAGHLVKGSAEAKAFMAKLRSMRK